MDFEQFKKEQEERLQEYNDQLLNKMKKKIRRKRKAATSVPTLHRQSEIFVPDKRSNKKVDKAALITARKI